VSEEVINTEVEREIARRTRRSFLAGGIAALAGLSGWGWLRSRTGDEDEPWPLRLGLQADEQLSRDYFRTSRLAPTFPASAVEMGRPNGDIGLSDDPDQEWKLNFGEQRLSLADIESLPKTVMITELKCIEGWSRVIQWGGARLSDFLAKFHDEPVGADSYVAMETPDGEYYVGLDIESAMHPQTLLCYEMNGRPLEPQHGAPLRLVTPVKYGIKNIKRIGTIEFQRSRPKDYWAERGYDWYAGF
jgi:hypothetical protein